MTPDARPLQAVNTHASSHRSMQRASEASPVARRRADNWKMRVAAGTCVPTTRTVLSPMANYGGEDEDMDGMTFHDRLEFWGMEVPPNKKVDVVFGETDEELVHLTQARSARRKSALVASLAAAAARRGTALWLGATRTRRSLLLACHGRAWPGASLGTTRVQTGSPRGGAGNDSRR